MHRSCLLAACLTLAPPAAAAPAAGAAIASETLDGFWTRFRAAVLARDMRALAAMAAFPVEGRGELDDDPVLRITPAAFAREMDRALARAADDDGGPTLLAAIRARPHLPPREVSGGDHQRVGSLDFVRHAGRWRLATIYRGTEQ